MYVGRIVGVGRTREGSLTAAYRVSSRSFPDRSAERTGNSIRIVPRAGSADAASDSPYIAYECLVWNERFGVVSNGTHTRPIFERLKAANTVRDATVSVLAGLDREFDQHDTPRICGVIDLVEDRMWLGSITATGLTVMPIHVADGQMAYVTTYEFPMPSREQVDTLFDAENAQKSCEYIITRSVFAAFDKPICATSLVASGTTIDVATLDARNATPGS
ncbi:IMP cyclohydrolase [Rhizobium leguminosarum]|uniref:IMP cyclohydrolase n=1 Tax=Rhizobium leguminosarum TaxID=384 RepID=UPI001030BC9F|nr:IMP cyclohydrolase [Rhizobium leguminosarum]TBG96003.1 IMP cyclohydrolase [Rhizobium leguminosarum]